jgi:hypothetical protein
MPLIGMMHLLIAIGFIVHAHKTGRPQFWYLVLIFLPLVGSIAYVVFELLPEFASSRRGRQVAHDLRSALDPDREWREKKQRAEESDNVEAKLKLAQECERRGMWGEAVSMYRKGLQGIFADDPDLMRGLARAQLGAGSGAAAIETLDALRVAHPSYQNQDAHMTYARALESLGRVDEAETEYQALAGYFIGAEARTRYALLLQKQGRPDAAAKLFGEVARLAGVKGVVLTPEDREWVKVAQRNL